MLKKQIIKKVTISSAILFSFLLLYIIPNKKYEKNLKQELTYIDKNLKRESIYLLEQNNYLARTSVTIDNTDITKKVYELLNILIIDSKGENKIPSGFKGVIPSNTEILGVEYKDNLIKINFNKYLLDVPKEEEEKIIEAIIYTLTSIKEIKKIIIYIDGKVLSFLPKSQIALPNVLDRNYGINKQYNIKNYKDVKKVVVYYLNTYNDKYYYIPVTKYLNDDRDKSDILITELSNNSSDLITLVDNNLKLKESKIEDNILYLTFNNKIFKNDEQEIKEEIKNIISLTFMDNFNVDSIIFKYNNKQICKSVIKTIE